MVPVTALRTCFATPDPISPAALTAPVAAAEAALVASIPSSFAPRDSALNRTLRRRSQITCDFRSSFDNSTSGSPNRFYCFCACFVSTPPRSDDSSFGSSPKIAAYLSHSLNGSVCRLRQYSYQRSGHCTAALDGICQRAGYRIDDSVHNISRALIALTISCFIDSIMLFCAIAHPSNCDPVNR